jgi:hypothetical protein
MVADLNVGTVDDKGERNAPAYVFVIATRFRDDLDRGRDVNGI